MQIEGLDGIGWDGFLQEEVLSSTHTCTSVDTLNTSQTLQRDMPSDHHHIVKTFDTRSWSLTPTINFDTTDGSQGGTSTVGQNIPYSYKILRP